jgi:hypothetical protein
MSRRRLLHPDGRSFTGELEITGDVDVAGPGVLGPALPAEIDAALAFDAIRDSLPGLHPTGLIHGARAFAYRWSQRRRGADPVPDNPAAVARTNAHR